MSHAADPILIAALHARASYAYRVFLDALTENGIACIPVKGVLLARSLYPELTQRPISDVDIRLQPEALRAVVAIAQQRRWPILFRSRVYQNLVIDIDGEALDIESHLGIVGTSRLRIAELIARSTRSSHPFGFSSLIPELHDHALLLVLNLFKDHIHGAAPHSFRDLELLVREPSFCAQTLVNRAKRGANLTVLSIVADWFATHRHDDAWREIRNAIGTPPRPRYAHRVLQMLSSERSSGFALQRVMVRGCCDARPVAASAVAAMGLYACCNLPWREFWK